MFKVKKNIVPETDTKSLSYPGPKMWDLERKILKKKKSESLGSFKFKKKAGSLKYVYVEYVKHILGKWGL